MLTRLSYLIIILFCGLTGFHSLEAQRSTTDLLPREWVVAEQNRYGDIVPTPAARYGEHFGFELNWDGRVVYTSSPARGLKFKLIGSWEYIPRERLLVFYYTTQKGNDGYSNFKKQFPPRRETYYVERINPGELVLRSRNGGRDFALLATDRLDPYTNRRRR